MGHDGLWQRIRWGNVARLAGLVALALVVAAWPRLRSGAPQLPPATAVPLAGAGGPEPPRLERPKAHRPKAHRQALPNRVRTQARKAKRPPHAAKNRGGNTERAVAEGASHAAKHTDGGGNPAPPVGGHQPVAGEPPTGVETPARAKAPKGAVAARPRKPSGANPDPAAAEFGLP